MAEREEQTYPPLDTLKPVAEDVWIVDGPTIPFGPPLFKMPFPTRMTLIRLPDGGLFIHSPTRLTSKLRAEIDALGTVRWLIGPNRIHYWWIEDWRQAYSEAELYLAPRILEQAKGRITGASHELAERSGYPWDGVIDTYPVVGSYMTEVVFFHRPTRTLVITDLIENFEPKKLKSTLVKTLAWLGGVTDPHGSMPRDMRLTYSPQKAQLRTAIETFVSWQPERVILAHGRWYEKNGAEELRRAFAWLL